MKTVIYSFLFWVTGTQSRDWVLRVVILALLPSSGLAKELLDSQVKAAVETWVQHVTADAKPEAVVEKLEPYILNGQAVAYIAHLTGGGFCLCGADDVVLPVYLYNPNGTYDPSIPDLRTILGEIASRQSAMRSLEKQDGSADPSTQTLLTDRGIYWQELIAGRIPTQAPGATSPKGGTPKSDPETLQLPLTSQWHQDSPYNDQCPALVPGQDSTRTVVGCVPTAAAQIMYYWKWPLTGVGSRVYYGYYPRRYSADWVEEPLANNPGIPANWASDLGQGPILEWTSAGGGKLRMRGYWDVTVVDAASGISQASDFNNARWRLYTNHLADVGEWNQADFGATTYNWSLMKDVNVDPPDAAAAEAAKLSYHLGAAIGVRYGVYNTSGGGFIADLIQFFRYDPDGIRANRNANSISTITEELRWFRPVELRNPPHSWVAYGYNTGTDPNRQFLMNLGWGPGTSHLWYTFDNIPIQGSPSVTDHETRIAPASVVRFVGGGTPSGTGSPGNPYPNLDTALAAVPDGTTLIFKAWSINVSSANPLTISRPLTLKGYSATITGQ